MRAGTEKEMAMFTPKTGPSGASLSMRWHQSYGTPSAYTAPIMRLGECGMLAVLASMRGCCVLAVLASGRSAAANAAPIKCCNIGQLPLIQQRLCVGREAEGQGPHHKAVTPQGLYLTILRSL